MTPELKEKTIELILQICRGVDQDAEVGRDLFPSIEDLGEDEGALLAAYLIGLTVQKAILRTVFEKLEPGDIGEKAAPTRSMPLAGRMFRGADLVQGLVHVGTILKALPEHTTNLGPMAKGIH